MRIRVLRFTYRWQHPECADALERELDLLAHAGHQVFKPFRFGNALIHKARSQAFGHKNQDDCDFLFMVDDDMLPEKGALLRLLEHDAQIASAVCTTRVFPVKLCVRQWDEPARQFVDADWVNRNRPVTGQYGVGGAFLLIRQDARQKLIEHYLSARDWLADECSRMNRMHVRAEYREKERARIAELRQYHWDKERYCRIFSHPLSETEYEMGEDLGFSLRLMQLKIPVTLDASINVGHVGDYPYGLSDYVPDAGKGLMQDPSVGLAQRIA